MSSTNEIAYADYLRVRMNYLYPLPREEDYEDFEDYEDAREHALTNAHHFAEEVEDTIHNFTKDDTPRDRRNEIVCLAKNWCETKETARRFVDLWDKFVSGWKPTTSRVSSP